MYFGSKRVGVDADLASTAADWAFAARLDHDVYYRKRAEGDFPDQASTIEVLIAAKHADGITARLNVSEMATPDLARSGSIRIGLPLRIRNRRRRTSIQLAEQPTTCGNEVMIGALRRAHALVELDRQRLPVLAAAPASLYERRLVRLAFLAPVLQVAIFEGLQPAHLMLEQLIQRPFPIDWNEQRSIFQLTTARSKLRHRSEASTRAAAMAESAN